jgi:hypothetical protein
VFKRVQSRAQRDFIVERMDSAVALLTDVNPNIEFFSIKAPAESLTSMKFTRYQMVKCQRHVPFTTCARLRLFQFSHQA